MKTSHHRESTPRFLILGAMDEEVQELIALLQLKRQEQWCGFTLYWGTLDSVEVVVCKSGIGKVFASLITQHMIDCCELRGVLFTGVAGAVAADLKPGDIVIGTRIIHHDFDVAGLGFEPGHIPFTDYRYFESDPGLVEAALNAKAGVALVRAGCIGTGDQFVTDKSILPDLGLDCVDMEGAAVAQVCTVNRIPFLIIRIISDSADGSADVDFSTNLPKYAHRSVGILQSTVQHTKL